MSTVAERYAEYRKTLEPMLEERRKLDATVLSNVKRGEFKRNESKPANDRERNLRRQREKKQNKTSK